MEYEESIDRLRKRVTYAMIQEYVESKYGFKVHTAYITEVKRSLGLQMYDAPNSLKNQSPIIFCQVVEKSFGGNVQIAIMKGKHVL